MSRFCVILMLCAALLAPDCQPLAMAAPQQNEPTATTQVKRKRPRRGLKKFLIVTAVGAAGLVIAAVALRRS